MIVKKAGILAATARTAVNMVMDFLKKKLPTSVGGTDLTIAWTTI